MKYSLKEADMPYQYILMQPLYIVVALKRDNTVNFSGFQA